MTDGGACQVGLANRIVANGAEINEAPGMAKKTIDLAPLARATMKRVVNDQCVAEEPGAPRAFSERR